ncbi:MAG: RdgB/HAM1 family non-canonical purine NTP pyrophosphatase [Anaerolineae bacterium]|nr:RdgB/HAM1 family non-canonical purine NTP pyrophosphatase [Anaerolineae bacterium]MCO5193895.1 RdgB/HAM1 family non-canonical purine NTP pyrophosphatase [Anaerolineae bacterium]
MKLLVATHNQGKVAELSAMVRDLQIECISLADAGISAEIDETGHTFLENATLKATSYAQLSGMLTLADDSGLEVDALDGAPGVHTARFGGSDLTQPERNALLLQSLTGIPDDRRSARFRCVVVLAGPDGLPLAQAAGTLEGVIASAPAGSGGFGYDPIFMLPHSGHTLAELSAEQKRAISHRGQAFQRITPAIRQALNLQP